MTRSLPFIVLTLLPTFCLRAQEETADDSATVHLPPVIIESMRGRLSLSQATASAFTIDNAQLRAMDGASLDGVLARYGGMHIRDLGGPSGVKTLSLRGAPAAQTGVILEGMPVNSVQNGLVDLGLFPAEMFERIEVIKGGQSADIGPSAMAGSVHLSGTGNGDHSMALVSAGIGSFGHKSGGGRIALGGGNERLEGRIGFEDTEGDFPYSIQRPTLALNGRRTGSSFRRTFISGSGRTTVAGVGTLVAFGGGVRADRGSPGPVTASGSTHADLRDDLGMLIVRGVFPEREHAVWEGGIAGMIHDEKYEDRSAAGFAGDRYINRSGSMWVQRFAEIGGGSAVTVGIEAAAASLDGSHFAGSTGRRSAAGFGAMRWKEAATGVILSGVLRLDTFSDLRPWVSPKVAMVVPLSTSDAWRIRASISRSFRAPSFNELYWIPGGSPTLKHESGLTGEAGIDGVVRALGNHDLSATVFHVSMTDRITGWPPVNLERMTSIGVEGTWEWAAVSWLHVRAQGTYCRAESSDPHSGGKQVPYVPRGLFSTSVQGRVGVFTFMSSIQSVSRRYTTFENLTALSSDPYTMVHCSIRATHPVQTIPASLMVSIDNVADRRVESVPGYPMPGRSIRVRLEYDVIP